MKEVDAKTAFDALSSHPDAILVDCRTKAEWMLIGGADLSQMNKQPVLIEWQSMDGRLNEDFCQKVRDIADEDAPIYVLCRVGGRSATATEALLADGFTDVTNIADGFEGPTNEEGHRSTVAGWRAQGLPWRQS